MEQGSVHVHSSPYAAKELILTFCLHQCDPLGLRRRDSQEDPIQALAMPMDLPRHRCGGDHHRPHCSPPDGRVQKEVGSGRSVVLPLLSRALCVSGHFSLLSRHPNTVSLLTTLALRLMHALIDRCVLRSAGASAAGRPACGDADRDQRELGSSPSPSTLRLVPLPFLSPAAMPKSLAKPDAEVEDVEDNSQSQMVTVLRWGARLVCGATG